MPRCVGVVSALLVSSALQGQVITGRVLDGTDSLAISGVEVRLDDARPLRSDGYGRIRFVDVSPGLHTISARMLGYAAFVDSVALGPGDTLQVAIHLTRVPRLLSTMLVQGHALRVPSGFEHVYRRASMNAGAFLFREAIDSINARQVRELLNKIPSVAVHPDPRATARVTTSRCRSMHPGVEDPTGPPVKLFLNGSPILHPQAVNEILDYMAPSSIQAIEVYSGVATVPAEYRPACAVVLIWMRRG